MHTLLLNADSQPFSLNPLSTLNWQDSIKYSFSDKFTVIKEYDNWDIRSPSLTVAVPSIMALKKYIKPQARVPRTRRNLWLRDQGCCQYCGVGLHYVHMTIDHVIPRSKGGRSSWQNLVTSCQRCNYAKGSKTTIKPRRRPIEPTSWELRPLMKQHHLTIPDPAWQDFLLWPSEYLSIRPR
tara:strand:- start:8616 stop:9158 length:543 start_codon:yes stop_codon:yes gene_type:complete